MSCVVMAAVMGDYRLSLEADNRLFMHLLESNGCRNNTDFSQATTDHSLSAARSLNVKPVGLLCWLLVKVSELLKGEDVGWLLWGY